MKYYDGLDEDGYPAQPEPWRIPYVRGSEAEVGDFNPIQIGGTCSDFIERARAAMSTKERADSPIETILGAAIIVHFKKNERPLRLAMLPPDDAISGLFLIPQFKWSIYRSDWAIYNAKTTGALLIECDGKDFHSSPAQIEHDKKKDQAAHDRGYLTMRFTGAAIHRDADKCAKEIFELVYGGRK